MKLLLQLLILQLPVSLLASNYVEKFEEIKKSGDSATIEKFLAKAAVDEEENPDYYATGANYWWQVSQSVSITAKSSEKDDFSVRDQKSGKEVGSISNVGRTNPEIPKRAITLLSEGVRRFPKRADMSLGLAHIQYEMGMHPECVDTLLKLLASSKSDAKSFRWMKNEKLPSSPEEFIPKAVQGYTSRLYRLESAEGDALCAKLCEATVGAFPEHPFAYNMQAALAAAQGKHVDSIRFLETASSKAPNDSLVLLNLGDAYRKAKEPAKAKQTYTKVLEIPGIDESIKAQAKKAIKAVEEGQ